MRKIFAKHFIRNSIYPPLRKEEIATVKYILEIDWELYEK